MRLVFLQFIVFWGEKVSYRPAGFINTNRTTARKATIASPHIHTPQRAHFFWALLNASTLSHLLAFQAHSLPFNPKIIFYPMNNGINTKLPKMIPVIPKFDAAVRIRIPTIFAKNIYPKFKPIANHTRLLIAHIQFQKNGPHDQTLASTGTMESLPLPEVLLLPEDSGTGILGWGD